MLTHAPKCYLKFPKNIKMMNMPYYFNISIRYY